MILLAGAIVIPLAGKITQSHAQGTVTITEFPIPTSSSQPLDITSGPDGNLWFTESGANQIGEITTSGTITEYSIPTSNSFPIGITSGPDGNLWFTEALGNNIGEITTSGTITEYSLPTSNSYPRNITSGPDGNLWFTETSGHKIGEITPSGTITEYSFTTSGIEPLAITSGPDGNLWFTEIHGNVNDIGKITPSGTITEYSLPNGGSVGEDITSGPDGNLWFAEYGGKIGKITTSGTVTEYPLPSGTGIEAYGITSGPDGNLWFTENNGNNIGEITTSGTIIEYSIPTSNSGPDRITSGPDGNLWFTENNANQIGRVNLPGCSTGSVTSNTQSEGNPSATACKTTLWGVDSADSLTKWYNQVKNQFGTPDFFGRYIGDQKFTSFVPDKKTGDPCVQKAHSYLKTLVIASEMSKAHSLGLPVLPIYFNYGVFSVYDDNAKGVNTWNCGEQYAQAAIEFAQSGLPGFAMTQGTAIFVDIENAYHRKPVVTDADFLKEWFDTFNSTLFYISPFDKKPHVYTPGYYKAGYYVNTNSTSSNFDVQFCKAVAQEPAIGTDSFIWTTQPFEGYVSASTTKANAPAYSPLAISCPSQQIPIPAAWQYSPNTNPAGAYPINVDIDEALSTLPLWKP